MKRTFLFYHLLLLACFCSLAQVQEVIPPSPNAASLGQYGEIPVNYHTGVPNIDIPLYTIVSDDIEVPISLSFHASGFKVGTVASWVGLGWSLNAGGTVSRSVRGAADETGFFYNMDEILSWPDSIAVHLPLSYSLWDILYYDTLRPYGSLSFEIPVLTVDSATYYQQQAFYNLIHPMKFRMYQIDFSGYDTQADLFFYNMPGASGKFTFKPDQSILSYPYRDLKIEANMFAVNNSFTAGASITKFTITTENGLKYEFDEEEYTLTHKPHTTAPNISYNSAWNLSKIIGLGGKQVTFTYDTKQLTQINKGISHVSTYPDGGVEDPTELPLISNYITASDIDSKYLETISWDGGSVSFYKSSNRADLPAGGQRLDSIAVFDSNGDKVKSFVFAYAPFTGQPQEDQHLVLLSVTELGEDGVARNPYEFEYEPSDLPGGDLPSRESNSVDHYGFYNGKYNASKIPVYKNLYGVSRGDADRNPGNGTSKVGMIKKIIYPTKGSSEFTYEANDYSLDYGKQWTPPEDQWIHVNLGNVTAEACDANGDIIPGIMQGFLCQNADTVTFTTPATLIRHEVNFNVMYDQSNPPSLTPTNFYVNIYKVTQSGNVLVRAFHSTENLSLDNLLEPSTEYEVHAYNTAVGSSIWAQISYSYAPEILYTGGVRVANVTHNDGSGVSRTINYDYRLRDDSTKSSGVHLANPPDYEKIHRDGNPYGGSMDTYQTISAHTNGSIGYLTEAHVVYSEVEVTEEGNGSTRYYYNVVPNVLKKFTLNTTDQPVYTSNFWKRGHLLKEEVRNEAGILLQEKNNYYSYLERDTAVSLVFETFQRAAGSSSSGVLLGSYFYEFDEQISGWARLDSTETISYELSKLRRNVTDYSYTLDPNDKLILPVQVVQNGDSPEEVKENITYLNDRVNHLISPVTQKITTANGQHVNTEVRTYTGKLLTRVEHRDAQGVVKRYQNLAEHNGIKPSLVTQHTGIEQYVLWGYDGDLPVAVISPKPPISQTTIDAIALHTFTGIVTTDVNYLKTQLATYLSNPDYEVQLFTHKPLIGITSQTDTNGQTTYYRYDAHGRLEAVLDKDQNFLKKYTYTEKAN